MKSLTEVVLPTAFIKAEKLSAHLNLDLTIASETFQHTGSFKFRAAYNLALNVPNEMIVTASSGNFGQAMAYACRLLGKRCIVVMPHTSAQVKIEAVRAYGAQLDLIDVGKIGRTERVLQIMNDYPQAYRASAYDDVFVIEGNASLGEEIADYEKNFDVVVSPVGGGGLSSGIVQAFCDRGKQTAVWGAEPLLGNDAARSLREGKIVQNETEPATIADGARTISLGENNWRILQNGLAGIIEVSDEKIAEGVRLYFSHANLKSEPTGALSLGAVLEQPELFQGKSVCLVVSGGNVDAGVYRQILAG
jgi:threonine dehydratase